MLKGATKGRKRLWRDPQFRKRIVSSRTSEDRSRLMKSLWKRPGFREMMKPIQRKSGLRTCIENSKFTELWRDGKFRRMMKPVQEKNLSLGRMHPSKEQIRVFEELRRAGVKGLKIDFPVDRFLLDIADPKTKRCAEIDGSYWHRNRKKSDRRRDRILSHMGWEVVRVPTPLSHEDLETLKLFFL